MPFLLYASNQLESLSKELGQRFDQRKTGVFQPDYVVTQTEGMGNWLKLQVATNSQHGIAANIRFLAPNDLIEKVYRLLGGTYQESFSSKSLCWLIFAVLADKNFKSKFAHIAAYYDQAGGEKDVRRLALAQKLADLFDQYQIYRPDMIDGWNKGSISGFKDEDWQQYLWLQSKELAKNQLTDKSAQWHWILEQLKNEDATERLKAELPEIHVFGISILAPYHLQILIALGQQVNVSFYFLNPAPQVYWYDTVSDKQVALLTRRGIASPNQLIAGNNLLTGWGRVLKDTFALLFQQDELINAYTDADSVEPATDSLLHRLQYDIFNNLNSESKDPVPLSFIRDGSISINSCYTIAREVECLYNYLVHLVDERREALAPRDIVVMVTDINAYAPYIKAVFDNARYRFPYSISDESFEGSDNMVNALKQVLEISPDTFTAENVLQLLDSSFVRDRFGISDLALIRRVIDAANIRFGITGDEEDDTVYVSWKYGLKRIIYGLCISGEHEYFPPDYDHSLFPLDIVEGVVSFELIRFVHFVEVLIDSIEQRSRPRRITEWVEYVTGVLNNLVYEADEQLEEDYNVLIKQLRTYNAVETVLDEPVSFAVFSHHFVAGLTASSKTASFIRGGVTFCSLIPMRSIPFKVIALLGLNFDKFPRKETRAGFDLMQREHRKGDRNVKDNDKHLFLETILSAKEYLYISYIGQSVKDNEPLPASAVVDELLDYIETAANDFSIREQFIVRHPLHAFSSQYNQSNPLLYSYLADAVGNVSDLIDPLKPQPEFRFEEVSLASLIRFFKNPFEYYYKTVLEIRYDNDESLLPETERFELDKLQKWQLRDHILTKSGFTMEAVLNRWRKTGLLPLKNMASIALDELNAEAEIVGLLLAKENLNTSFEPLEFQLPVGDTMLSGTLTLVQARKLVVTSFSSSDLKHLLTAYISFLAGRAAGVIDKVFFVSGESETIHSGTSISQAEALSRLTQLLDLYKKGHNKILPFHLKLAHTSSRQPDPDFLTKKLSAISADPSHSDEYLVQEASRPWLHLAESAEELLALGELLITPLLELFPTAKFKSK